MSCLLERRMKANTELELITTHDKESRVGLVSSVDDEKRAAGCEDDASSDKRQSQSNGVWSY